MDLRIEVYMKQIPVLAETATGKGVFWVNSRKCPESGQEEKAVSKGQIQNAVRRLEHFAPYLAGIFPETAARNGIIGSELREIRTMRQELNQGWGTDITGKLFLKMNSHLPISGPVKTGGGIYGMLKHAEDLTFEAGLLSENEGYRKLNTSEMREFFGRYKIQVGSTGNLRFSTGTMNTELGSQVTVHMSTDAKQWKRGLLRSKGVAVIEYESDYRATVEEGGESSDQDPMSYSVDDRSSVNLSLGHAVTGQRLKHQLEEQGVQVDRQHPLFVYLSCGVGGAPGGMTYGLKEIYGDHVHYFFMEPTQARRMLIGMATGKRDKVCVGNFGISGKTDADGLTAGRPSAFVGKMIEKRPAGIYAIEDGKLHELIRALMKTKDIFIEPSACASFAAFLHADEMDNYIGEKGLSGCMRQAVHITWATGGNIVPPEMVAEYLNIRI